MDRRIKGLAGPALLTLGLASGSVHADEGWEWALVPYGWAVESSLDLEGDDATIGTNLPFDDLLDKIDAVAQIHFEGRRGNAGFFLDLTYLNTSDDFRIDRHPTLPGGTLLETDVKTTMFEAGGFMRPFGEDNPLELLLGLRTITLDLTLDVTLPDLTAGRLEGDDTLVDGFVGARVLLPLNDNWFVSLRGDLGTGDTERTWNAVGLVGYQFGKDKQYDILGGYRYLDIELEEIGGRGNITPELTMAGPIVGFALRF